MEKQGAIIARELKTSVFESLSEWIKRVDITIFKVAVDYIVRNFDPTGINIWGLVDSFYNVLVKPRFLSLDKLFRHIAYHWRILISNLFKSLLKAKLVSC